MRSTYVMFLLSLLLVAAATSCDEPIGSGEEIDRATLDSLSITVDSLVFDALGDTVQVPIHVTDTAGEDRSDSVAWSTRDASVVGVDDTGLVTSEGVGTTWVVAEAGELADSAEVTVRQVVAYLEVSAPAPMRTVGDSVEAVAEVQDANGFPIPDAPVTWSSLDPSVIEMQGAWAHARGVGNVALTVASGELADTVVGEVAPLSTAPTWDVMLEGLEHSDVWASSATDVWAVGTNQGPVIRHFDGTSWERMPLVDGEDAPEKIWGAGPSDLWGVAGGYAMHYNGTGWVSEEVLTNSAFTEVHGAGGSTVYAVTNAGGIWAYDGTAWTQATDAGVGLRDVWVGSASDVWAVGGNRTVVHYDGSTWNTVAVPTDVLPEAVTFHSVGAPSPSDVWVGSYEGVLHYDGTTWTEVEGASVVYDIWGSGPNDVWLVAGRSLLHYDGTSLTNRFTDPSFHIIHGVWGTDDGSVFAAGSSYTLGATIVEWDGSAATVHQRGIGFLMDVWGSSPTNVWAISSGGDAYHYDGFDWTVESTGVSDRFLAIWGSGADVFAAGRRGHIVHHDGTTWSSMSSGTSEELRDLWGRSATDVYAVGAGGTVLRYDGAGWAPVAGAPGGDFLSVTGTDTDLFVGSLGGAIHHYDGTEWRTYTVSDGYATPSLWSEKGVIWSGHGSGYVGEWNRVLPLPSERWSTERPGLFDIEGLAGTEDPAVGDDVVAAGYATLLHQNGAEWTEAALPANVIPALRGVAAVGPDQFVAVGFGIILIGSR